MAAFVLLRYRVQSPADLDVEIKMHLDLGEHRHLIGRFGGSSAPAS